MRVAVLVPTYKRPQALLRCLDGIARQERLPDQVLIAVQKRDRATVQALESNHLSLPVTSVYLSKPGVVAALNAGLEGVAADIVCITDDDAVPKPDWLRRIEVTYQRDSGIAGVGGRDFVHDASGIIEGNEPRVGLVLWYGKVLGNHHIGTGPPRPVDVLKGANMSFRMAAIQSTRFDDRLRGGGAQVHLELAFCLALRKVGQKLVYDPRIAVDHYPEGRQAGAARNDTSFASACAASYNASLALLEYLTGIRKACFIIWTLAVGSRGEPGLAWLAVLPWSAVFGGIHGKISAFESHAPHKRPSRIESRP